MAWSAVLYQAKLLWRGSPPAPVAGPLHVAEPRPSVTASTRTTSRRRATVVRPCVYRIPLGQLAPVCAQDLEGTASLYDHREIVVTLHRVHSFLFGSLIPKSPINLIELIAGHSL